MSPTAAVQRGSAPAVPSESTWRRLKSFPGVPEAPGNDFELAFRECEQPLETGTESAPEYSMWRLGISAPGSPDTSFAGHARSDRTPHSRSSPAFLSDSGPRPSRAQRRAHSGEPGGTTTNQLRIAAAALAPQPYLDRGDARSKPGRFLESAPATASRFAWTPQCCGPGRPLPRKCRPRPGPRPKPTVHGAEFHRS